MLRKALAIDGYAIAASDGRNGTVNDILFDDASWLVRWLIVDTGKWLSGRKVLLPPSVLGQLDPSGREFAVSLTMQQVKDSPDVAQLRGAIEDRLSPFECSLRGDLVEHLKGI